MYENRVYSLFIGVNKNAFFHLEITCEIHERYFTRRWFYAWKKFDIHHLANGSGAHKWISISVTTKNWVDNCYDDVCFYLHRWYKVVADRVAKRIFLLNELTWCKASLKCDLQLNQYCTAKNCMSLPNQSINQVFTCLWVWTNAFIIFNKLFLISHLCLFRAFMKTQLPSLLTSHICV